MKYFIKQQIIRFDLEINHHLREKFIFFREKKTLVLRDVLLFCTL